MAIKNEIKTDLQKFIDLYKGFGIELNPIFSPDLTYVIGIGDAYHLDKYTTDYKKIETYPGFYSEIIFDKDGKFIKQTIFE